jgi:hypothetical protein
MGDHCPGLKVHSNQPTIPIKGNPANAGAKFYNFLGLFGPGKLIVTVTNLD